jgi:hypothetical protein
VSRAIDRFLEAARVLGHEAEVRRFPEGTKTAEAAARAVGCEVGQIVKSLVFMAGNEAVLALTSGANRVDTRLAARRASGARRADPEERGRRLVAVGTRLSASTRVRTIRPRPAGARIVDGRGTPDAVFGPPPTSSRAWRRPR